MNEVRTGSTTLTSGEITWLSAGDPHSPAVVCLHGFPDTAHCFDDLLPALAEAGWHAVAPWLPGYAPSAVPPAGDYRLAALAATIAELATAVSPDRPVALVGHDWGAGITYELCASRPELVSRAVAMSVPHPSVLAPALLSDYAQQKRSWYMFLFQLTGIAEIVVGSDDLAFVDRLVADWSPGWDVPRSYHDHITDALGGPANLAAALGYYRAMFSPGRAAASAPEPATGPITTPLLYLHGVDDGCVGAEHAGGTRPPVITGEYRADLVDGCGHFLLQEQPAAVVARITDWLGAPPH
ncbi:MAG: alpha/beta hydrolase [Acidimicrobiia bacterium]|nr:alpha/beta hydrolase [Acidimicrobiia bacterium]